MNDVKVRLNMADGFRTVITAGKNTLIADEPESLGGRDEGMAPYELLLSSLGACTAMTLRMYADRKQIPISEVEVHLTYEKIKPEDCEGCTPEEIAGKTEIQHISRIIYVTGELTTEQEERLKYVATRCPVHITLHSDPHVADALIVKRY
ncbi:MAG: OsmC family protein [Blastocatellia bacterium]|jgi:putative redox protein